MKGEFKNLKPIGKCPICTINLWAEYNNRPAIWPCGVNGCPYETAEEQAKINQEIERSAQGSGLALIFEQMD